MTTTVAGDRTAADQIYEINAHLLYELKWMILAASQFAQGDTGHLHVALIDSATVHARNLFEFGRSRKTGHFTLYELGGTPRKSRAWDHWANNRVTHMTTRETDRAPWPEDLDNDREDRLMVMAKAVLDRLDDGAEAVPPGPTRLALLEVLAAARTYWHEPTEENHQRLSGLYDGSRDHRSY